MNQKARMASLMMLPLMMLGCTPERSTEQVEVERPADELSANPAAVEPLAPLPAVAAPSTPSGSMVVYACDDGGGLTITYDKYGAMVKLPTGSTMLSRAEASSSSYDEAYIGEELSLYRTGGAVQLQLAGKARNCTRMPTG